MRLDLTSVPIKTLFNILYARCFQRCCNFRVFCMMKYWKDETCVLSNTITECFATFTGKNYKRLRYWSAALALSFDINWVMRQNASPVPNSPPSYFGKKVLSGLTWPDTQNIKWGDHAGRRVFFGGEGLGTIRFCFFLKFLFYIFHEYRGFYRSSSRTKEKGEKWKRKRKTRRVESEHNSRNMLEEVFESLGPDDKRFL